MLDCQPTTNLILELIENNPDPDALVQKYIRDLVKLEYFIHSEGPQSFRSGIDFYFLKSRYEKEYVEMLHELKPDFSKKVEESWRFFFG